MNEDLQYRSKSIQYCLITSNLDLDEHKTLNVYIRSETDSSVL